MAGNTTQTHTYTWWSPDGITMVPVTLTNPFPVTQISGGVSQPNLANQYTALASASETTIITAIAATYCNIYGLIAANTTASAVTLIFKDSTGGTTQFVLYVPANDTRGFMLPSSDGFKQTTADTNWTCTGGASGVDISALYAKNN